MERDLGETEMTRSTSALMAKATNTKCTINWKIALDRILSLYALDLMAVQE